MFTENLDENSSFTFHLYPFLQIPDDMQSTDIHTKLEESLYRDVSYEHLTKNLKKPLWCGETGHPLHMPDSYHALYNFISILEDKYVGWALWPLKDCGAMGMLLADKKGEWNKLCTEISDNWVFWDIFSKDSILSAEKEKDKYSYYKWLANESTNGWKLVRNNLRKISFDRLVAALDDFKFENCTINKQLIPTKEWYI